MVFIGRLQIFIAIFVFSSVVVKSQDNPIGFWESHLPYNTPVGVATDGSTLFTICLQPFYTYRPSSDDLEPYSKVNGMSDIGMQCIAFDRSTSTAVLVYTDGNIDLFKNNTFYNIPDFKIKSIAGNKAVNQVYCENGIAYLSTSVGVLVIDLNTHNINETYQFIINNQNIPVLGLVGNGDYFYAITQQGLYKASKNNPQLQNFAVWTRIDSSSAYLYIASVNNTLFLANQLSVFGVVNDVVKTVYTCPTGLYDSIGTYDYQNYGYSYTVHYQKTDSTYIQHIDAGTTGLLISEFHPKQYNGDVLLLNTSFQMIDTCRNLGSPQQAVQLSDNSIWIADAYYGLEKRTGSDHHFPPGPSDAGCFDMYANNKNLWIVHGGLSDKLDPIIEGYHVASNLADGKWTPYERFIYAPFDNFTVGIAVTKQESTGAVYIGSFVWGLFILNKDGSNQLINGNSVFDSSHSEFGAGQRQVGGIALDQSDNLWVATLYSYDQLYVKTSDSIWHKYHIPGTFSGGPVTVDDNGIVWVASLSSEGLVAYNPNGTLADLSDDSYYHLFTGIGSGNLPSNNVHCLAKDKNNNIWVGTDNGIGIVSSCTFGANTTAVCDATIPIVQYDLFAGYLFAGNNVRTIAVDGANRKWIGTDDGVWLLSSNAQKIIYRFTTDNSPLPSNLIQKITIDKVTGDVYIGTDQGLVCYRSTATDGGTTTASTVSIFPNPVPKDYTGTIAIKGLAANSDVRITDVNDQLVCKTTALGGQAVWDGKDYKGHRPQSGVYLVFAASSDGNQVYTGKIVFIQ